MIDYHRRNDILFTLINYFLFIRWIVLNARAIFIQEVFISMVKVLVDKIQA